MPNTVTTYYTFAPATKARSSEVNQNFNNYRGTLLPINENTATASDNTHYLGASDHYWAGAYLTELDLRTSTTTSTLILKGDTTATTGAFLFQIEGTTVMRVPAASPGSYFVNTGVTTLTFAWSAGAGTAATIPGLTLSITSYAGKPFEVSLIGNTTTESYIQLRVDTPTIQQLHELSLNRNGTLVQSVRFGFSDIRNTTTGGGLTISVYPISAFRFIDIAPSIGGSTYDILLTMTGNTTSSTVIINDCRLFARELW